MPRASSESIHTAREQRNPGSPSSLWLFPVLFSPVGVTQGVGGGGSECGYGGVGPSRDSVGMNTKLILFGHLSRPGQCRSCPVRSVFWALVLNRGVMPAGAEEDGGRGV